MENLTADEKKKIYNEIRSQYLRKFRETETKMNCGCGKEFRRSRKSEHEQSVKHQKFVNPHLYK